MTEEEWRPTAHAGIEVSNLGQIRGPKGLRKLTKAGKGYLYFSVHRDGRSWPVAVHELVAMAFLGPRPPGAIVNHENGDKTDPRASNLTWSTFSRNLQHAYDTGLRVANVEAAAAARRLS